MKKKKSGFIKISHDFVDHPLYSGSDAFNLKEVYLDLNLRAFYQDTSKVYRNKLRTYHRGQVEGSIRQFADWWHMTKDTAMRRLRTLQENGLIFIETSNEQTVVTLRNYCTEQDFDGIGCDTNQDTNKDTNQDTHKDTDKDTNSDNLKKTKEVIKNSEKNQKNKPSADFGFVKDGMKYE